LLESGQVKPELTMLTGGYPCAIHHSIDEQGQPVFMLIVSVPAFFSNRFADADRYSILFHEFVHYKQHQRGSPSLILQAGHPDQFSMSALERARVLFETETEARVRECYFVEHYKLKLKSALRLECDQLFSVGYKRFRLWTAENLIANFPQILKKRYTDVPNDLLFSIASVPLETDPFLEDYQ
ncbi:MAG: hypothetical protein ABIH21_01395, partial [Patescibacteria group bacterium]